MKLGRRQRRRLRVQKRPRLELSSPNESWCTDFAHSRLENGTQVRILAVLDCFTRELLLLKAAPHFTGSDVQRELEWLFLVRGKPSRIVSDNGPEFRKVHLPDRVEAPFIQPGHPWENGRVESFWSRLRDELLNRELFYTGSELQGSLNEYAEHYNRKRPHRSSQGLAPTSFRDLVESKNKEKEDEILTH